MRKLIISVVAFVAIATASLSAQDFKKEGKTYSKATTTSTVSKERSTGFTWKDSKDNQYDIYMGASGACYIKKTSQKTGKEYKQYLGEEVSRDICKSLGVEYTSKSKQ